MSAEDLEKYETEMELSLYREYKDIVGQFSYVVETERRFYLANSVELVPRNSEGEVYFELRLADAWVWDMYRPARFVKQVRVITFKDVKDGTENTAIAFGIRCGQLGIRLSMGSVGDCYDNAMIEAFWSRMQVELLDRQTWRTRVALANAIFEYLEILHNRQRRHSALGMLTPVEFEARHLTVVA